MLQAQESSDCSDLPHSCASDGTSPWAIVTWRGSHVCGGMAPSEPEKPLLAAARGFLRRAWYRE